jgi:hypothetical protein
VGGQKKVTGHAAAEKHEYYFLKYLPRERGER